MLQILYLPLLIFVTLILAHAGTFAAVELKTSHAVHQSAKQTNPVVIMTYDSVYLPSSIPLANDSTFPPKEQTGSTNLKPLTSPTSGLHQAGQDAGSNETNNHDENNDEEGNGPPPWVPGPPPWAGSDEDNDEEGNGPPPWVPGPPPWAGHGQEDEYGDGVRNGPPSWVPGSPPFAGAGE